MARLWAFGLTLWLISVPAGAEVYRCVDASGTERFTDDRSACPGAAPHALPGEIQRSAGAAAAAAPPEAPIWQGTAAELLALFPPATALGPDWEIVEEAPSDPAGNPDLWAQGVRTLAARHYTRGRGRTAQACSLEIWAFVSAEAAKSTLAVYAPEGWQMALHRNLLLQLHGVTLELGAAPRKGIAPECASLLSLATARISARGR
jgi:Domain of unknown function (DUF4124)